MKDDDATELRERIAAIKQRAAATWDLADVEPSLVDLLVFLTERPRKRPAFEIEFVSLLDDDSDGVDETIGFCMHTLRWPRVEAVVTARRDAIAEGATGSLWNERRRWERLAESFRDDWPDAVLYEHYRS